MVVVAVLLAGWICVIWWQDNRTLKQLEARQEPEAKLERFDSKEKETSEVVHKAE